VHICTASKLEGTYELRQSEGILNAAVTSAESVPIQLWQRLTQRLTCHVCVPHASSSSSCGSWGEIHSEHLAATTQLQPASIAADRRQCRWCQPLCGAWQVHLFSNVVALLDLRTAYQAFSPADPLQPGGSALWARPPLFTCLSQRFPCFFP
jgi:hypothetical protein